MKFKRSLAEVFDPRKLRAETETWVNEKVAGVQSWLNSAQHKMNHMPETNFDLGVRFARAGELRDAVFRFRLALKLRPDWAEAWYELGLVQMRLNEKTEAAISFKNALRYQPAHADARYLLAVCDASALAPEKRPTTMPTHMVQGFFSDVAPQYAAIEAQHNYNAAKLLVEALRPHLPALSDLNVIDAGCGIGHAAMLWRKVAMNLVGIDITDAMVAQARATQNPDKTQLFDKVHAGDVRTLRQFISVHSADVILCANVLQFVGDLDGVFAEFAASLKAGGLAAITVEPYSAQHYGVVPETGRFGHSAAYVAATAAKYGLDVASQQKCELYPGMPCMLFVLKARPVSAPAPTPYPEATHS